MLLLLVLDRVHLVDARAVVGGVPPEGDVQVLQEQIHPCRAMSLQSASSTGTQHVRAVAARNACIRVTITRSTLAVDQMHAALIPKPGIVGCMAGDEGAHTNTHESGWSMAQDSSREIQLCDHDACGSHSF